MKLSSVEDVFGSIALIAFIGDIVVFAVVTDVAVVVVAVVVFNI